MKAGYIIWKGRTPQCNLPGSPFSSRIQAKKAAQHAKIAATAITKVRKVKHAD